MRQYKYRRLIKTIYKINLRESDMRRTYDIFFFPSSALSPSLFALDLIFFLREFVLSKTVTIKIVDNVKKIYKKKLNLI